MTSLLRGAIITGKKWILKTGPSALRNSGRQKRMIEYRNVCKNYGDRKIVKDLSFTVEDLSLIHIFTATGLPPT